MKYIITTGFLYLLAVLSVHAQMPILTGYFEMKEALVNSDAVSAAEKAGEFTKAINSLDIKLIPAENQADLIDINRKLVVDACEYGKGVYGGFQVLGHKIHFSLCTL